MAVPIDVATGPGGPEPDVPLSVAGKAIEGRSLGQIAWLRLRRDKVAMGGGIVVVFLILVAIIGPHVVQNPDVYNSNLINPTFLKPIGAFGGISLAHPLGVEPETGRDILARIVVGAQYSLLIAFLATVLAVGIGTFFGVVAGYFGGWVDSLIARAMDVFLAFPLLVFALALAGVIPSSGFGLSGNSLRVGLLIFVIGFFAWPYMGRIIRGQTLSLREREFVDAARSLGASRWTVFYRVTLPLIWPSLAAGAVLTWARALGEFGATITFAGNLPGVTQTMPLAIYISQSSGQTDEAIALSLILVVVSLVVMIFRRDRSGSG